MIFDAGSTGTRVNIFQFMGPDPQSLFPTIRTPKAWHFAVNPGLHKLQGKPDKLKDYMDQLWGFIQQNLPDDVLKKNQLNVILNATPESGPFRLSSRTG